MPRPLMLDRRRVLALAGATVLAAGWRGSASADDTLSHLSLLLGVAGTTLDTVGRALGDAARQVQPNLQLDIQNAQSNTLLLKQCFDAAGRADELCFLSGSVFYQAMRSTGELGTQFSALGIVGALGTDRRALYVATSTGITNFAGLLTSSRRLIVPTPTATSPSQTETLLINALTGARLKPVPGYGSAERKLALMSGEATAAAGSIDTFDDLVQQGLLRPVLRINDAGPGAPYADVPLLNAFARGPDAEVLTDLVQTAGALKAIVVAPPGLSEAQLQHLSALFDAAAAQAQTVQTTAYQPAEIVATGRAEVEKHVEVMRGKRQAVDAAFARAVACGQSLADGTACAAGA